MAGNRHGVVTAKAVRIDQAWQINRSGSDLVINDFLNSNVAVATIKTAAPANSLYIGTLGVGILNGSPDSKLTIGNVTSGTAPTASTDIHVLGGDTLSPGFTFDSFGSSSSIIGRRAQGTNAAKTTLINTALMLRIAGSGYGATAYSGTVAAIDLLAEGTWTDTSYPSAIVFRNVASGSTTLTERMRIFNNGNVGIGTGATLVNDLRILDIQNVDNGASAGSIVRLITRNTADSANTSADFTKYKTGEMRLSNNETNSAAFLSFYVGASERARINSSGFLGVGTGADPAYFIHLKSAGNPQLWFESTTNTINNLARIGLAAANATAATTFGQYEFYCTGTVHSEKRAALITCTDSGAGSGTAISANLNFYTTGAGTLNLRMVINSSGVVTVGPGLTGGTLIFDVNGSGRFLAATPTTGAVIMRENASNQPAYLQWVNNTNLTERGWVVVDETSVFKVATGSTERLNIDGTGNMSLGAVSGLNDLRYFDVYNLNNGASAGSIMRLIVRNAADSAAATVDLVKYRTGGFLINNNDTAATNFIAFGIGGVERARIDNLGRFGINATPDALFTVNVTGGPAQNTLVSHITQGGVADMALVYTVSAYAPSGTASCMKLGHNSTTSRSLNAGGTLNASGADYAEYMTKSGSFNIEKGEVCGVDQTGRLTKVFDDAISFVIKSTNPSYVGGDTWASEAVIGKEPEEKKAKAAWQAKLETLRAKVDRIAFSGQVPCNISGGFSAGDYVIPMKSENGGIKAVAVKSPSAEQYMICVGRIWANIGRKALVAVKIS